MGGVPDVRHVSATIPPFKALNRIVLNQLSRMKASN